MKALNSSLIFSNRKEKKKFSKKNIISLINTSDNFQGELIEDNQKHWKALIEGDYKDMTKTEVAFSNKQLEQLKNLIIEIVPPMVRTIIKEEVPPIVEKIVDQKLDPIKKDILEIKKDIEAIKNCPTIKKELYQNNN